MELIERINLVQQSFLMGLPVKDLFDSLLEAIIIETDSGYGFIGEIFLDENDEKYLQTHAITNIAWNEATTQFYNENKDSGLKFENLNTLFGECIKTGKLVITNDAPNHNSAGGVPSGHPSLNKFLGVPLIAHNKMVGMFGVSNRPNGYDVELVKSIEPLISTIAALIYSNRMKLELESATRVAVEANVAKSNFLSNMSHEIRTPLNGILGLAQLHLKSDLDTKQIQDVETILGSGNTLLAILNDILDMEQIETGNIQLDSSPYDIADLLNSFSQTYIYLAKNSDVSFNLNVDLGGVTVVVGDQLRLQQILSNLLNNAFKFTSQGEVTLSVEQVHAGESDFIQDSDHTLRLMVSDTGKGIVAARLSHIFDVFSQEDETISRRFGGSGLGLSIVKNFSKLMGGSIAVSSTEGQGSVFTVLLPFGAATEADILATTPIRRPLQAEEINMLPLKILVAEDNIINATIARGFLEGLGHAVTVVENGLLALNAVKENPDMDIIFMDVHMPQMDGIEATKSIRQLPLDRYIPIIGLTAEAFNERVQLFKEAGMDEVISKPFKEEQLILAINEHHPSQSNHNTSSDNEHLTTSAQMEGGDSQKPIGDSQAMLNLAHGLPEGSLNKLLTMGAENISTLMLDLQQAIQTADTNLIKITTHSMKGSLGSLYAIRMASMAEEIEENYQDIDFLQTRMPALERTASQTISWLQSLES